MARVIQTEEKSVEIKCPHCEKEFEKEIIVDIYEPSLDLDIEIK